MNDVFRGRRGRRRVLATSVALAGLPVAGAIDGFLVTPRRLELSVHAFGAAATPAARLRIAHVSDLHMRSCDAVHRQVLDALASAPPDVIVHTGDMVESARGLGPLREFFAGCPGVPSFAIPGNWEYTSGVAMRGFERLCEEAGIEWLVNRSVVIPRSGTAVRITGVDDLRRGRPDAARAVSGGEPVPNHLVLAHCPAFRDRLGLPAGHRADLVLSGHTHGGQVAPFGMPLVLPPGSGRYVAGWYGRHGDGDHPPLYVSRGVGTSLIPIRLGSVPEVALFDWDLS
ncbi:MAG: metallophosphoesterase [Planctomycetia bacterium]